jgi:hypothetical protein
LPVLKLPVGPVVIPALDEHQTFAESFQPDEVQLTTLELFGATLTGFALTDTVAACTYATPAIKIMGAKSRKTFFIARTLYNGRLYPRNKVSGRCCLFLLHMIYCLV